MSSNLFQTNTFCILLLSTLFLFFTEGCSLAYRLGLRGWRGPPKVFKPLWAKNHDPLYNSGNLPIGVQNPSIYQGIVYIGHNKGEMRAYDIEDGRLIWKAKDNGAYHSGVVLMGDYITYGTVKGRAYSRHRLSGKLLWSVDLGASIETDGVLFEGRLYYHTRNHKIFCLDAMTGKILWAFKRSIHLMATLQRASRPLVDREKLYVGLADGTVVAFSLQEGIPLWERKIISGSKFIDADVDPLLFHGELIVAGASGLLTVLDKKNGLIKRRLNYSIARAPLIWGEHLILGTVNGEIVILDKNLRKVASQNVSTTSISSILPWKKGFVVATVGGYLLFMNSKDLSLQASYHLGHQSSAIFAPLKAEEGKLVVYSARNRLYVFE